MKVTVGKPRGNFGRLWLTWRGFMFWGRFRHRRVYRSFAWAPYRHEDERT